MTSYRDMLTVEPGIRSGQACVRGSRITVYDVLGYLAGGMSVAQLLHDFPSLTLQAIEACLAYAADKERHTSVSASQMDLLWDHNLSPQLVHRLLDLSAQSVHIAHVGLESSSDEEVWSHAKQRNLVLVSKDQDFNDLVSLLGAPPKLIWLRLGNCTTDDVEGHMRSNWDAIEAFESGPGSIFIVSASSQS